MNGISENLGKLKKQNNKTLIIVDTLNLFQFFGWTLVINLFLLHIFLNFVDKDGENSNKVLNMCILILKITQTFQITEPLLALLKIGGSSFFNSTMQLFSRFLISLFLTNKEETLTIALFIIPWSIGDAVRSIYYIYKDNKLLGIMRYNLFIVLYPMGVTGEILLMEKRLTRDNLNDYYYYIRFAQVTFFVGFAVLYSHLLRQRKKYYSVQKKE